MSPQTIWQLAPIRSLGTHRPYPRRQEDSTRGIACRHKRHHPGIRPQLQLVHAQSPITAPRGRIRDNSVRSVRVSSILLGHKQIRHCRLWLQPMLDSFTITTALNSSHNATPRLLPPPLRCPRPSQLSSFPPSTNQPSCAQPGPTGKMLKTLRTRSKARGCPIKGKSQRQS